MVRRRGARWLVFVLVLGLVAAACGGGDDGGSSTSEGTTATSAGGEAGDLETLVQAAKAERELVFYSAATENVAKRAADGFQAKYGITARYVRLPSQQLQQRYASEAEAGNFAADVFLNAGNSVPFAEESIKKGWVESISEAGIPAIEDGTFPKEFMKGPTAIVQIGPWGIAYNTDKVKGADVPKDWADILKPKFRGQILLPNPGSSDAYIDLWELLLRERGDKFFADLRNAQPRRFDSGVPAVQALGAGEGAFALPVVPAQVQATQAQGAPLAMVTPDLTVGVEIQVTLTAPDKAKHPNAARLFAHYLMTEEGNKVLNDDPGSVGVFDTGGLPSEYQSPKPGAVAEKAKLVELLGF